MNASKYIYTLIVCATLSLPLKGTDTGELNNIDRLHVTLVIFSGRPNPTFLITGSHAISMIAGESSRLPAHPTLNDDQPVKRPNIGYNGFIVENLSKVAPNLQALHVYRSNIQLIKRSQEQPITFTKEMRIDEAQAIEALLIEIGKTQGVITPTLAKEIEKGR